MKKILITTAVVITLISAPFTSAKAATADEVCTEISGLAANMLILHYAGKGDEIPLILDSIPEAKGTVVQVIAYEIYDEIDTLPIDVPQSEKDAMTAGGRILTYQWCMQHLNN